VSVYGQKDFLLNDWTCLYSANFPGEHIIQGAFFHNGRRVVAVDKKSDAVIPEKIQMLRFSPTLKGFGGVACEGVLVVTASGLICVAVSPGGG
ncbi:mediator of RNA polymerase II transcription subunit 16, partial [Klebsiella pneumoniae]|nr:mediator of RNA polymerase II transcription subunit 16 [Klebsiella pneumoniae]